jgi:hypothetical protein
MKIPYVDLHAMSEDDRIDLIGRMVLEKSATIGCFVDLDGVKGDRYISKVKARFPSIVLKGRCAGPTPGVETLKFGPPVHNN